MLLLNLEKIIKDRGYPKPNAFLVSLGFNYYTANRLLNNVKTSITFFEIERICIGLKCLPSDMFVWKPSAKERQDQSISLARLAENADSKSIGAQLKEIPFEHLSKIQEFITSLTTTGAKV